MESTSSNQQKLIPPEFKYLSDLVFYRIKKNFGDESYMRKPAMPPYESWHLRIKDFEATNKKNMKGEQRSVSEDEATLLLLAIAPHIQPDLLDQTIQAAIDNSGEFPQLGGIRPDGRNFRGFLPTGETALFALGEDNYSKKLEIRKLFAAEHFFSRKKILWLEDLPNGEPFMSGRIIMSQDYIDTFIYGKPSAPHFSANFPAKKIEEKRTREKSLVINQELNKQVDEISTWVKYNSCLMNKWGMSDRFRKGYRALFFGPPGTGKTLTAGILGNELEKEVYKIDISMVVSKFIGETEKNLELLFARAEDKGWILFFDEADALFGKRTDVRDAHDKYANQEVSYLLQRIEDYDGLIILATNKKNNIDDAFIRRFNAVLKFSFPDASERADIWNKSFPENISFVKEKINQSGQVAKLEQIEKNHIFSLLKKYELSGGNIINVVHYACLKATERKKETFRKTRDNISMITVSIVPQECPPYRSLVLQSPMKIYFSDILKGIRKELTKEGKPFIEQVERSKPLLLQPDALSQTKKIV